jgi:hypothetical protein
MNLFIFRLENTKLVGGLKVFTNGTCVQRDFSTLHSCHKEIDYVYNCWSLLNFV